MFRAYWGLGEGFGVGSRKPGPPQNLQEGLEKYGICGLSEGPL